MTKRSRAGGFSIPLPVPVVAVLTSVALIGFVEWEVILLGTGLIVFGGILSAVAAWRGVQWEADADDEADDSELEQEPENPTGER